MRYRGGGVGHKSTREATDFFKNDRDRLDIKRRGWEQPANREEEQVINEDSGGQVEDGSENMMAPGDDHYTEQDGGTVDRNQGGDQGHENGDADGDQGDENVDISDDDDSDEGDGDEDEDDSDEGDGDEDEDDSDEDDWEDAEDDAGNDDEERDGPMDDMEMLGYSEL